MALSWDYRVVPAEVLDLLARAQELAPSRVAGGAALSGVHLAHRLSRDVDVFFDEKERIRELLPQLGELAAEQGGTFQTVRDGGAFVRGVLRLPRTTLDLDLVYDPSRPLAPRDVVQGVVIDSFADLRANKLTCLLSRIEPRDLVDVYFLEKAGHRPEADMELALQKDGGMDPGILAHLVASFPVAPLPQMLVELSSDELVRYRDALSERFRQQSVAGGQ
jgi:hypothetical protein